MLVDAGLVLAHFGVHDRLVLRGRKPFGNERPDLGNFVRRHDAFLSVGVDRHVVEQRRHLEAAPFDAREAVSASCGISESSPV
jgi:hypothetical protein